MRVLIAGGGIGGLTLALALERQGVECRVFEFGSSLRALGVGINLLPHAVSVLAGLGILEQLESSGVATAELRYHNRHGQLIWAEKRGREAGYPFPQISIHRGRLTEILFAAVQSRLGASAVSFDRHLMQFQDLGDSIRAEFSSRTADHGSFFEQGDILIAADGIHSRARQIFYPAEAEPKFSGRLLWRGVTVAPPFLDGRTMIMAGHADQKFVAYAIQSPSSANSPGLINWVAELLVPGNHTPPPRDWNRKVPLERFLPAFQDWCFPWLNVPALIEGADEVFEFPMIDRDPVGRWSFGRVSLLGDAAHPMYPIGSNGASQAILDAEALTHALIRQPNPVQALEAYQAARLEPTSRIVLANRKQGPERVMQLAEERAPQGFSTTKDVFSVGELEAIAAEYKQLAGFARA